MEINDTDIEDVKIITPIKHGDHRGFFSDTYNQGVLERAGINANFVQDNQSLSQKRGTLRGLHYQAPPFAQDKLVRVTKGAILDVAVDIRKASKTYGRYISAVISKDNWNQIFIPKGFAHGFVTLEDDTEVQYKVSNFYAPKHDFGVCWNDPFLNIKWGFEENELTLSDKDKIHPTLSALATPF